MQRLIKFRAWSTRLKIMHEWKYLLSGYSADSLFVRPKEFNLVMMQYTGLKDKNGKEIYEGDIIEHENGNILGVVEFHSPEFIMTIDNMESFCTFNPYPTFQLKIIGNIYENGDLLNAKD